MDKNTNVETIVKCPIQKTINAFFTIMASVKGREKVSQ